MKPCGCKAEIHVSRFGNQYTGEQRVVLGGKCRLPEIEHKVEDRLREVNADFVGPTDRQIGWSDACEWFLRLLRDEE